MSATPNFVGAVENAAAAIATANANRDGTGTVATLFTASGNGARIDDIAIKARATTTAGMVRFFLHDGTNYRFLYEVAVTAVTPSATVKSFESYLANLGWCLKSGWSIRVSTEKAEAFDVSITRMGAF